MSDTELDPPERLLDSGAIAERLMVGRDTVLSLARSDDFPRPFLIGKNATRWRERDVNEWIRRKAAEAARG